WFFNGSIPMITSDNWSSSSHKGNLYLVWGDNLSASPGGTPSIEFSVNGGGGWSTPATIATGGGLHYFNPSVSIQSNGTIWVTFLGLNPNNGYFRLYGIYSTNAGATWSGLFPITDQPSTPLQDQFALGIGSVVATPVGAYSFWSDCRGSNCQTTSGFFNWTWFGALVHPVSLSATTAGVQATVTLGGSVTNYNLPVNLGWDSNVSVTVSVTAWVTAPNGTWIEEFQSFGGASTSSSDPVTFSYLGGNLVAKYLAVPGSWIGGTLSPMVAGATLRIIDPIRGTINANLVSGSGSYGFNLTVPGGASYTVVGAAAKYRTNSTLVVTTQFRTTTVDMVLAKINGWIQGLVNASTGASGLAGATITVNGTMVPGTNYDPVTGRYNVSEPWGTYNVAISEPGFKAVPGTSQVTVSPGVTTTLPLALEGAWINGTVTPASALVKINGAPASLSFQGASANFVSALPGGTYQVVASLSGFSTYNQTYTVKPGDAKTLIISLTNRGFIRGVVSPAGAVVYVNGAVQAVFNGAFNVSELASATPYEVTAKSQGYETGYANITVVAGETSWINFTLMKPSTTPHNCTYYGNCTSTKPNTAAGGLTTLDLIGIGIVVLLVVVIAAVLLMRRGKSGGGGGAMPQSPSYEPGQDGGSTSSGSMMDASEPSAGEPPSV
ncbi:MAG TPA: PEGA domain-containing protein, partial [Thermoplasmata archaeon]|nr:PEGA domain-containing protein [Thermoplasmata archaeon]